MKKLVLVALVGFLFSCSTSNDVVSNRFIQKRKYTKGWHINKTNKLNDKTAKGEIEEVEVAVQANETPQTSVVSPSASNAMVAVNGTNEVSSLSLNNSGNTVEVGNKTAIPTSKIATVEVLQNATNQPVSIKEIAPQQVKKNTSLQAGGGSLSTNKLLLIIIAIFISWLAVGLYTNWEATTTIINLILWLLFFLPGFIHALLVILDIL